MQDDETDDSDESLGADGDRDEIDAETEDRLNREWVIATDKGMEEYRRAERERRLHERDLNYPIYPSYPGGE